MPARSGHEDRRAAYRRYEETRARYDEVMAWQDRSKSGSDGLSSAFVPTERKAVLGLRKELDKELARQTRAPKPALRVRSDYFGTVEHKALGDLLRSILAGENPFSQEERKEASLLLWKLKGDGAQKIDGALELSRMDVVSTEPGWQKRYLDETADVLQDAALSRDLPIRGGITLRYGDIIALAGDYFADPQSLHDEITDGVMKAIRAVMPRTPGTTTLTLHRPFDYIGLALKNTPHFTPWNWARYTRHHAEALLLALGRDFEGALVRNAFADHFLTDAFASGHLRTPRSKLSGLDALAMHDEDNEHGLWVRNLEGFAWRAFGDNQLGRSPVHLAMTTIAVARSLKRLFIAYRLEGEAADVVRKHANEALAGTPLQPDHPPLLAGAVAPLLSDLGVGLPSVANWLPVPLAAEAIPGGKEAICNYPPKFDWGGKPRKGTPSFEDYYSFTEH